MPIGQRPGLSTPLICSLKGYKMLNLDEEFRKLNGLEKIMYRGQTLPKLPVAAYFFYFY